jgi:hypothetical protein
MELGWPFRRIFKHPAWAIPAICFNNNCPSTATHSIAETSGILKDLRMGAAGYLICCEPPEQSNAFLHLPLLEIAYHFLLGQSSWTTKKYPTNIMIRTKRKSKNMRVESGKVVESILTP